MALNTERHLYSAERPSRWALAHILVLYRIVLYFIVFCQDFSDEEPVFWMYWLQSVMGDDRDQVVRHSLTGGTKEKHAGE